MRSRLVVLAMGLVLLLAGACGGNSSPSSTSEFNYPTVQSPAVAPLLRWDFSGQDEHNYSIEMGDITVAELTSSADQRSVDHANALMTGDLVIKSLGNGTAEMLMTNLSLTGEMWSEDRNYHYGPSTEEQQDMGFQGMREDGTVGQSNSSEELLIKLIFPLPPEPLSVGESVVMPVEIPFKVTETDVPTVVPVYGNITLTLMEYVDVDGQACAHIAGDIDVGDLQDTEDLLGEYEVSMTGISESLFSLNNSAFVSARIDLVFIMNGSMPMESVEDEDEGLLPYTTSMDTYSELSFVIEISD